MSEDEPAQREAILSRLKELLHQQIEQFRNLTIVLEKQQAAIESGNEEAILAYIEIEERFLADIFSIQKAIDPLEIMYRPPPEDSVYTLKSTLEEIKNQVISQSKHNKSQISGRMAEISGEIESLRNNPLAIAARRSLYYNTGIASLIDIEG